MCARYTYVDSDGVLRVIVGFTVKSKMRPVAKELWLKPRYNAAIGDGHPIVMNNGEAAIAQWGLVPSWSQTRKVEFDTFNAKAETLSEKRTYAPLLRYRRCLVPADGMIEFRKEGKERFPYHVRLKSRAVFCFAGLWDLWHEELLSYTVITTAPNELIKTLHNRMGAILHEADYRKWLDEGDTGVLKPYPAEEMEAVEINRLANSPKNDFPEVLGPPTPPPAPVQSSLF
jgi:putative SOS response-associated peptidase YedK